MSITRWIVAVIIVGGIMCLPATDIMAYSERSSMIVEQRILDVKNKLFIGSLRGDRNTIVEAEKELVTLYGNGTVEQQALMLYYIGYARLSVSNLSPEQEKEAHLNRAINALEQCVRANQEFADGFALLSAAYGQKASLGLFSAMQFGLKSGSLMDKALTLAPDNPRVQLLHGVATYYKPSIVGGSKKKGVEILHKANKLFSAQAGARSSASSLYPTWGLVDSIAWLGVVALDAGNKVLAKQYFDQALAIAPEYAWVKTELYPKL